MTDLVDIAPRTVEERLDAIERDIAAINAVAQQAASLLREVEPIMKEAQGNPVKLMMGLVQLVKSR